MSLSATVVDAQVEFVEGKLQIKYFNVSVTAGTFPNSLNGTVRVAAEEGVSITSTPEEVTAIAKKKVQDMVAEDAPSE